jgi:hypothetical protein
MLAPVAAPPHAADLKRDQQNGEPAEDHVHGKRVAHVGDVMGDVIGAAPDALVTKAVQAAGSPGGKKGEKQECVPAPFRHAPGGCRDGAT